MGFTLGFDRLIESDWNGPWKLARGLRRAAWIPPHSPLGVVV